MPCTNSGWTSFARASSQSEVSLRMTKPSIGPARLRLGSVLNRRVSSVSVVRPRKTSRTAASPIRAASALRRTAMKKRCRERGPIHKSKGKQFDGVIVIREGRHNGRRLVSSFVWRDDDPPYWRSRKILRVGVTRARIHTLILERVFPACPIMAGHNL